MLDFIGLVHTGPVLVSLVFSFRYRTDWMPDSPAFRHLYTRTCTLTHTHMHGHAQAAWTCTCVMDMEMNKHHGCRNAEKIFSLASLVFHKFTILSPSSAFRHRGQSGTESQRLVR
jgi:hypothetical protein